MSDAKKTATKTVVEMTAIQKQFYAARLKSVPLLMIRTADPSATIAAITKVSINRDEREAPVIQWDAVRGYVHVNQTGQEVATRATKCLNPVQALEKLVQVAPEWTVAAMMIPLPDTMFRDLAFIQAIWNLRDEFKRNWRTLVLVVPNGGLPAALEHDVLLIDEPLPGPDHLRQIAINTFKAGGLPEPDGPTLDRVVDGVAGLSAFATEQAIALSLRRSGLDFTALREKHRQMVENAKGLTVWRGGETFKDIGGLSNFKSFAQRVIDGTYRFGAVLWIDEIEKAFGGLRGDLTGISQDYLGVLLGYMADKKVPGILLMGHPGCLAGDTVIEYSRGARVGTRAIRLDDFYKKFNGLDAGTRRFVDLTQPTFIHSLTDGGVMFRNRVIAVLESGVKPLVRVTFDDGSFLRATPDHPVLTPTCGFVEASSLREGQEVMAEGSMRPQGRGGRRLDLRPSRVMVNVKYHPYGSGKTVNGYDYQSVARARLVVEAGLNDMEYDEYVHALKHNPELVLTLRFLPPDWDVHHVDENPLNDDRSNLTALPRAEHARLHGKVENFNIEYVVARRVESVIADGEEMTYDIQMDDPTRNFVANGIVVHNTGKSAMAKAMGNTAHVPTIRADLQAMHGSLVGESQHALRHALKIVSAVSQERPLFIATCNSVAILPPEFVNRFKWRFFVDLPDDAEKQVIWDIHLKGYGIDRAQPRPSDLGWNGREIEQCCATASELKCSLVDAATYVVPISTSSAEDMERRKQEANGRYLSASYPGAFSHQARDVIVGGVTRTINLDDTWVAPGSTKPN